MFNDVGEIVAPGTPPLGHPWGLTSGRAGPGWGLTVPGWGPHTSVGVPRVRPHMPRGGGVTRGNTKLEIARSPPSFNICILVTPSLPNRDAVPTYRYTPNRDAVGPTKSRCGGTCRIETVGSAESRRWDLLNRGSRPRVGPSRRLNRAPGGASRAPGGGLTPKCCVPTRGLTREAPGVPEGGGPWGYNLAHITT